MTKTGSNFVKILICVLCIAAEVMLISNLFRSVTTGRDFNSLTFSGLLQSLQNASTHNLDLSFINLQISGSWGIFDFLRVWLNSITSLFSFSLWFVNAVYTGLNFLFQFMISFLWM